MLRNHFSQKTVLFSQHMYDLFSAKKFIKKVMDSLFDMERFDPSAEDDTKPLEKNDKINKLKLKRKIIPDPSIEESKDEGVGKTDDEPPSKKKKKKNKKKVDPTEIEGFTILGDPTDKAAKKVNRVLPYWLANPNIVNVDLLSSSLEVSEMPGLEGWMIEKLAKEGISSLFPVQRQVIPHLMVKNSRYRPGDVCVSAPTGSGKTLAFVLPIVQCLADRLVPRVRCVAVLPTQELASQVYSVFNTFTVGTGLRVKLLTGAEAVIGEGGLVRRGVGGIQQLYDILVATPGRLTHTIKECQALDLSHLRYLVIDEADRMMENIAQDWLNILEGAVYSGHRKRPGPLTVVNARTPAIPLQKLLFSATLSHDPEQLEQLNLFEPSLYRCVVPAHGDTAQSLPVSLSQLYLVCRQGDKPLTLHRVLTERKIKRALVFTHSNDTVHRLALLLAQLGHSVAELSSEVAGRKKVLAGLSRGLHDVVVCSDVVARGIDLEDLEAVVSYDVPAYVKTYIHRVGRTARAGRSGLAVTLCEGKQEKNFLKMLKDSSITGIEELKITEEDGELRQSYQEALEKVKERLTAEKAERGTASDKNQRKKKNKK